MSEIWQRKALGDAPLQQRLDMRRPASRERQAIGIRAEFVREPGDKEHQFSRFVARIGGAVTEIHARRTQRPRTSLNRGADAFGRANAFVRASAFARARRFERADAFDSSVG